MKLFTAEDHQECFSNELRQEVNNLVNHGLQYLLEVEGCQVHCGWRVSSMNIPTDLQRIPQSLLRSGGRAACGSD